MAAETAETKEEKTSAKRQMISGLFLRKCAFTLDDEYQRFLDEKIQRVKGGFKDIRRSLSPHEMDREDAVKVIEAEPGDLVKNAEHAVSALRAKYPNVEVLENKIDQFMPGLKERLIAIRNVQDNTNSSTGLELLPSQSPFSSSFDSAVEMERDIHERGEISLPSRIQHSFDLSPSDGANGDQSTTVDENVFPEASGRLCEQTMDWESGKTLHNDSMKRKAVYREGVDGSLLKRGKSVLQAVENEASSLRAQDVDGDLKHASVRMDLS